MAVALFLNKTDVADLLSTGVASRSPYEIVAVAQADGAFGEECNDVIRYTLTVTNPFHFNDCVPPINLVTVTAGSKVSIVQQQTVPIVLKDFTAASRAKELILQGVDGRILEHWPAFTGDRLAFTQPLLAGLYFLSYRPAQKTDAGFTAKLVVQ